MHPDKTTKTPAIKCPWQLYSNFTDQRFCYQKINDRYTVDSSLCSSSCAHFAFYEKMTSVIMEKEKIKEELVQLKIEMEAKTGQQKGPVATGGP